MLELLLCSNMLCDRSEHLEAPRDLVLELQLALEGRIDGVPFANLPLCQRLFLEAAAHTHRSSHQDVGGLEVAMDTAFVVEEAKPSDHAVQDVADSGLREGGFLNELAHVNLVQVEREADVRFPIPIPLRCSSASGRSQPLQFSR